MHKVQTANNIVVIGCVSEIELDASFYFDIHFFFFGSYLLLAYSVSHSFSFTFSLYVLILGSNDVLFFFLLFIY